MSFFLITYTLIALVIVLVAFIELVSRRVIFANNRSIQRIFGHPLLRYSIRRIGSSLVTVLLAVIVTFFLIRATVSINGGIDQICNAKVFGGKSHTFPPSVVAARCAIFREEMGFAGNSFEQLWNFLYSILPFPKLLCTYYHQITETGLNVMVGENCRPFVMDLGKIFTVRITGVQEPVYTIDFMMERMMVSFPIMMIATAVSMVLGYPLGILMAKHKDGVIDHAGNAYIVFTEAIPGVAYYYIWMALLVGVFALPASYIDGNPISWLPAIITMGFSGLIGPAFWMRRFMVDEFSADYVKFARAKGLSEGKIMSKHVFRNALVPLVRGIPGAIFGSLLGSFFIENMYQIPGIGGLLMSAVNEKEYFALQGIVIVGALISIISFLLGDIVTAVADPRIRLSK